MDVKSKDSNSLESPYLTIDPRRTCPFDPPQEFLEASETGMLVPWKFHAGHTGWLVTSNKLAKKILADSRFSVRADLAHTPNAPQLRHQLAPGLFHQMDAPDHTRLRSAVASEFAPARMTEFAPVVYKIAEECLENFKKQGPKSDFVKNVAHPFPLLVVCQFLNIPKELSVKFIKQSAVVVNKSQSDDDRAVALRNVFEFLRPLMQQRTKNPQGDMLSRLVQHPELQLDEAVGIATQILIAGSMVPAAMLGYGLYAVLEKLDSLQEFSEGPNLNKAIEELLRYLSFESQPRIRVATKDVTIGNATILSGQLVAVALDAANRDGSVYLNPDSLDVNRDARGHLAFGWGPHQCLGRNLARLELATIFPLLNKYFPNLKLASDNVEIVDDGITRMVTQMQVQWQ